MSEIIDKHRVLIMIGSAGIDPWLAIEKQGQEPFLNDFAGLIPDKFWISGQEALTQSATYRLLNSIAKLTIDLPYASPMPIRRMVKAKRRRAKSSPWINRLLWNFGRKSMKAGTISIDTNRIQLPLPNNRYLFGLRTIENLRFALDRSNFDFLIRLTSNCVVNGDALMKFITQLPAKNRVYMGQKLRFNSIDFISGAAILFSRDTVEEIVKHSQDYALNLWEDVALGKLVADKLIAVPTDMPRLDLRQVEDLDNVAQQLLEKSPIIRCKAQEPFTRDSLPSIELMHAVASRLQSNR